MKQLKVGVALSGGVDSTSAALLLRDQYSVTGFFMQLAQPNLEEQTEQAIKIAERLAIPLKIIDLGEAFERHVLQYFSQSYFSGFTPNPCIICNHDIKFGLLLDAVLSAGMDKIATGHYARITFHNDIYHLLTGVDQTKDQSYFLSRLAQRQLANVLFPLGNLQKNAIYEFAEKHGFTGFRGKESQDVCFLENTRVADFLKIRKPDGYPRGQIKDLNGNILGEHDGIANYTIGQRRGLGISGPYPYYVLRLDATTNSVIVGKRDDLYHQELLLHNLHLLSGSSEIPENMLTVKIRSTHKGAAARLFQHDEDKYRLCFTEPQRAVTPGQFAVFYRNDELLGSAEIIN